MAVEQYSRNIAGSVESIVGGNAAVAILTDWSSADNWLVIVELTITGHGETSCSANVYYRRQSFKWTDGAGAPVSLGALVATTIIEEDAAWDAVVALNANSVEVQMTGDAAEIIDWTWSGTVYMQRII